MGLLVSRGDSMFSLFLPGAAQIGPGAGGAWLRHARRHPGAAAAARLAVLPLQHLHPRLRHALLGHPVPVHREAALLRARRRCRPHRRLLHRPGDRAGPGLHRPLLPRRLGMEHLVGRHHAADSAQEPEAGEGGAGGNGVARLQRGRGGGGGARRAEPRRGARRRLLALRQRRRRGTGFFLWGNSDYGAGLRRGSVGIRV